MAWYSFKPNCNTVIVHHHRIHHIIVIKQRMSGIISKLKGTELFWRFFCHKGLISKRCWVRGVLTASFITHTCKVKARRKILLRRSLANCGRRLLACIESGNNRNQNLKQKFHRQTRNILKDISKMPREVDFDVNVTNLYAAIGRSDWDLTHLQNESYRGRDVGYSKRTQFGRRTALGRWRR